MEPNAPIGLWPELEFQGEAFDDIRNIPFFFYTDGLNEAENLSHDQFTEEHMMSILQNGNFGSAKAVVNFMRNEVEKFRNGAEPNDDLTMLCLKLDKTA
jgi:serine phosphatase RsbU (regulator of sigma subunit)